MGDHDPFWPQPDDRIPSFDAPYWRESVAGAPVDAPGTAGTDDEPTPPGSSARRPTSSAPSHRPPGGRRRSVPVAVAVLLLGAVVVAGAQRTRASASSSPDLVADPGPSRVSTLTVGLHTWPVEREQCTVADGRVSVAAAGGGASIALTSRGPAQASLRITVGDQTWSSAEPAGRLDLTLSAGRLVASGDAQPAGGDQEAATQRWVPVHLDVRCAVAGRDGP